MSHAVSQERTRNYISQVKGSVVYKGLAVVASFLAIPLMIRYLGQEQFGVWSTMLSVMSWIIFFDLGIGNGLRNKLAESLARNEIDEAARYISSGYSLIGLISLLLLVLVAGITSVIPWQRVFNTQAVAETTLKCTVLIAASFIFLNFWLSLINQILNAAQKASMVVFGQFISNSLALGFIIALTKTTDTSLPYLAVAYGMSLIVTNLFLSFQFYRKFKDLIPKPSLDNRHIRPLLSIGMQFFTIQIAVLIIFTTDKILITQLLGPQYVTQYDVVFKLFSIITIIHTLISAPLWSSYTDAYHRGDFAWIKRTLYTQLTIFGIMILAVLILAPLAKSIISLWIGNDIEISTPLIISMGVFVLVSTWNNIFAHFVNGIGKIKAQLLCALIAMMINVPLAIILTKHFGLGTHGIVMATCISLIFFAVVGPIQAYVSLYTRAERC